MFDGCPDSAALLDQRRPVVGALWAHGHSGVKASGCGFEPSPLDSERPPIVAAPSLLPLLNHLRGQQTLAARRP